MKKQMSTIRETVQFDGHTKIEGVIISPVLEPTHDNPGGVYGQIKTAKGWDTCVPGDWITTNIYGEKGVVKR